MLSSIGCGCFGRAYSPPFRRGVGARSLWAAGSAVLLLVAAGCRKEEIRSYRIPKEAIPEPRVAEAGAPAPASAPAGMPGAIEWKLPEGWEQLEPTQFRVGNFQIPAPDGGQAGDVSIIPLPGQAGTDLANVNRWRGQVGLPPVNEQEMNALAKSVTIAGEPAKLFEFAGKHPTEGEPVRMLAAILRRGGMAWFFKASGPDQLIAEQRTNFIRLLASVRFGGDGAGAAAAAEAPEPAKGVWPAPEGWRFLPPGNMQQARYALPGPEGEAPEVSVAALGGDGGGLLANVNRWRRQLGLPPIEEGGLAESVSPLANGPTGAQLVSLENPDTGQAMLVAVLPAQGQTWFVKMTGSPKAVREARKSFLDFIRAFPHGR